MTSVEYNIDLFMTEDKFRSIKINEMNRQIAVSTFKILLRCYDLTSILGSAIKSGKLTNFSTLGDVTGFVNSGLNHFVRFETRCTERVQTGIIKSFLKKRATDILQGATHKTMIDALLGIESMAFHQSEHAKMLQSNADQMYGIEMGQHFIKAATRNIANTVDKIKSKAANLEKKVVELRTTTEAKVDRAVLDIGSKVDAEAKAIDGTLQDIEKKNAQSFTDVEKGMKSMSAGMAGVATNEKQLAQQMTELGNDFTGLGKRLDGFEGELIASSGKLDTMMNASQQATDQVQVQLQQLNTTQNGIETILANQQQTEKDRLALERQRDVQKEMERKKDLVIAKIEKIKDDARRDYGVNISREFKRVLRQIKVPLLGLLEEQRAAQILSSIEKMLEGCIAKKSRISRELVFDKAKLDLKKIRYT
jgi:hypothetical protein